MGVDLTLVGMGVVVWWWWLDSIALLPKCMEFACTEFTGIVDKELLVPCQELRDVVSFLMGVVLSEVESLSLCDCDKVFKFST